MSELSASNLVHLLHVDCIPSQDYVNGETR